ncbi:HPP family protein [Azospirillum doebereinerae]|uniref:HPP family protein n=1 Tax=Azospirillum doebereinerae TaxID=92933 RepID=UPI001EE53984|nr:HPP family protein [Azospirillum doebereinerae]MCG5238626.1 HPP family protein [Azospirillum doebereinerae]
MTSFSERSGRWCRSFMPAPLGVDWVERLRGCGGAFLGILATGIVCRSMVGTAGDLPLLIAPMGASAVLLFAAPASPLAQPWSVLGGNVVAALVGVACAQWIGASGIGFAGVGPLTLAAALAVCGAIAAMMALRCLHPPGGAVALMAVLGGPAIQAEGFRYVLLPVGLNALILLAIALIFNNATRRRYPHAMRVEHAALHDTADPPPGDRLGFTPADLDAVLKEHNEFLDISRDDLDTLFREAELRGHQRRFGTVTCADIMSRDVIGVAPDATPGRVWELMHRHRLSAVPVLGARRKVVGVVTQADLLTHAMGNRRGGLRRLPHRLFGRRSEARAADMMGTGFTTVSGGTPVTTLVPLMSDGGLHHMPVVDDGGCLIGVVTQTDLVAGLHRGWSDHPTAVRSIHGLTSRAI